VIGGNRLPVHNAGTMLWRTAPCQARRETFTMDPDPTKALLDQAAERYNEGLYEEAITLWRQVLAKDPANQNAREGIRMARLLTADWAGKVG